MKLAIAVTIGALAFGSGHAFARDAVISFDGFCDVWDVSNGSNMGKKVAAHADATSCRTFIGEGFIHKINGTKFAIINGAYQGDGSVIYTVAIQVPFTNGGFVDTWKTTDGINMNFIGEHNYSIVRRKAAVRALPISARP
jgi:hypothetical protein